MTRTTLLSLALLPLAACGNAFPTNPDAGFGDEHVNVSMGEGDDNDGDGYGERIDCDDDTSDDHLTGVDAADINPGADELCGNLVDDNCDGTVDTDGVNREESCYDGDHDGFCDDYSGDGSIDQNDTVWLCEGTDENAERIAEQTGGDMDDVANYIEVDFGDMPTYDYPEADCDDAVATTYPGADEACDGADNDCDDVIDDGATMLTLYADTDLDLYGNPASSTSACSASVGWVTDSTDCDDAVATTYPGAAEACDSVDNDCDGSIDDGVTIDFYMDGDDDGFGDEGSTPTPACEATEGWVADDSDCDDSLDSIYPGAAETCANDGTDNDCDGSATETPTDELTWFQDSDSDAYGETMSSFTSCTAPSGFVATSGDCDDSEVTTYPGATELFDGVDNNCDGSIDNDASCNFEIQILEDAGTATSLTGVVSDNALLTGSYLSSGTPGVTVTPTSLGGDVWEYLVMMDLCMSTTGSVIIDGEFTSGESLGDDPIANVFAYMDSTELDVDLYDNGDGTWSYELTRP